MWISGDDQKSFNVSHPLKMIGRLDPQDQDSKELVESIHSGLRIRNRRLFGTLSEEKRNEINNSPVAVLRLPNGEDLLISETIIKLSKLKGREALEEDSEQR